MVFKKGSESIYKSSLVQILIEESEANEDYDPRLSDLLYSIAIKIQKNTPLTEVEKETVRMELILTNKGEEYLSLL